MGRTKTTFRDATAARHAYRRADVPMIGGLDGDWKVEFYGNAMWLDALPKAQRALGLNKLFGMRFSGDHATHLVGNPKKTLSEVKPLIVGQGISVLDAQPTATMVTAPGNGKLWELFTSELRVVDRDTLVGFDLIGWGPWQVPMPFVLMRHQD